MIWRRCMLPDSSPWSLHAVCRRMEFLWQALMLYPLMWRFSLIVGCPVDCVSWDWTLANKFAHARSSTGTAFVGRCFKVVQELRQCVPAAVQKAATYDGGVMVIDAKHPNHAALPPRSPQDNFPSPLGLTVFCLGHSPGWSQAASILWCAPCQDACCFLQCRSALH